MIKSPSNSLAFSSPATSSDDDYSEESTDKYATSNSTDSDPSPIDKEIAKEPTKPFLKFKSNLNDNSFRRNLELNLRKDLNTVLKSEHNFYQKNKPITISEEILIDECLMLLSGLKPNMVFLFVNGDVVFNSKFQLKNLNKELHECLRCITYHSKIIFKLEHFVKMSTNTDSAYTQTYEAFSQCIIEFMKYFKRILNDIGRIGLKKEIKFSLNDLISKISDPFFQILDLLDIFLVQIEKDFEKESHEKSANLLALIHKYLIDSYSIHRNTSIAAKFLMWVFAQTIRPLLTIIDSFIEEGINLDLKHELGFKRNTNIQINNPDYWTLGFEVISKQGVNQLPGFLRTIITSAFKISKHMEIIKLLGNFNKKSSIYESFLKDIFATCPYLIDEAKHGSPTMMDSSVSILEENLTFLRLNAHQLDRQYANHRSYSLRIIPVESLIDTYLNNEQLEDDVLKLDLEATVDDIVKKFLFQNLEWCSSILIEKLFDKFHMYKYFEFIHSYYLYKSNETMFIFSKKLFDLIKNYELYQEDAILNNLFYNSANSVFTFSTLVPKTPFNSNSVTFCYDETKAILGQQQPATVNANLSSRLISKVGINLNVKWPLNIIIKPSDLASYNRIFLFFLQIKQAKYDLDSLNLKEMDIINHRAKGKKPTNPFSHKYKNKDPLNTVQPTDSQPDSNEEVDLTTLKRMFLIRYKLINFINNAHDLICNQIYEAEESFLASLKIQTVIDEIIAIHSRFLAKILKNCLLDNKQFQQILLQIFNITLQFCDIWRRGITYFTTALYPKLVELDKNIDVYFGFVYRILSSLLNRNQQTHFQPLIASLTIDGVYLYKK